MLYGRGSVVAMGATSALFASIGVGTVGRIVAVIAAFVCGSLVVRRVLHFRRRA